MEHTPIETPVSPQPVQTSVTYRDLINQTLVKMKEKRKLIFWRVLFITAPSLAFIALIAILKQVLPCIALTESQLTGTWAGLWNSIATSYCPLLYPWVWFLFGFMIVLCIVWGFIFRVSFLLEKNIWIDSAFDGKEITPQQSRKLSFKLFAPAIIFYVKIWVRYYLVPLVVALVVFIGFPVLLLSDAGKSTVLNEVLASGYGPLYIIIAALLVIVGLLVYLYYLKIKLRNMWFIFLDAYHGGTVDFNQVIIRINALNAVTRSKAFKQILILQLGTASANVIVDQSLQAIGGAISRSGVLGQTGVGQMVQAFGAESARQFRAFADMTVSYIFYRIALKEISGKEQEVNMEVYNLVG